MTARQDTLELMNAFTRRGGIAIGFDDANTLRRAQLTLHRWAELECGDGDNWKSWSIERDETTNIPYFCVYQHDGKSYRRRTPDRETAALKRVETICKRLGIHYYHQTDPRGCQLYISAEPFNEHDYTKGLPWCV